MDKKDLLIVELLKRDAKLTTSQLSKKTGIPITTIHNRLKRLEKEGIIKGYTIIPDYAKLEKSLAAYILLTVSYRGPVGEKYSQEEIAKEIRKLKGVEEVCIVTGQSDVIAKVRVKDVEELNKFVIAGLREIEGVDKTQTLVVLNEISQ